MKGLEQMLEKVECGKYKSIDIYAVNTTALYSTPAMNFNFPMAYSGSLSGAFDRQSNLFDYGVPKYEAPQIELPQISIPNIEIVPYSRGMELDGGFNLYGNKSTAIIHDPYINMDYHHHSNGGGSLNFGQDRFTLPYEKQTNLFDF